jgi:hypothetical protein
MMNPREEIAFKFSVIINDHFKNAMKSGLVADLEGFGKSTSDYLDYALSEREEQIIELLESMIRDWESTIGEDDKTLYSLGLRRAIDKIVGGSSD